MTALRPTLASLVALLSAVAVAEARLVVPAPRGVDDGGPWVSEPFDLTGDPERAIRAMLEGTYVPGLAHLDMNLLDRCFLADTRHVEVEENAIESALTPEWVALQQSTGEASEFGALRTASVDWVDATGDVAQVKVRLEFETSVTNDYLSLVRLGGEWRVVAKTSLALGLEDGDAPSDVLPVDQIESTLREFLLAEADPAHTPHTLRERCHPAVELRAPRRDGTLWSHTGVRTWEVDPLRSQAGPLQAVRVLEAAADGRMASVKLESTYRSSRIIDYWTLLSTAEGWQVLTRVSGPA